MGISISGRRSRGICNRQKMPIKITPRNTISVVTGLRKPTQEASLYLLRLNRGYRHAFLQQRKASKNHSVTGCKPATTSHNAPSTSPCFDFTDINFAFLNNINQRFVFVVHKAASGTTGTFCRSSNNIFIFAYMPGANARSGLGTSIVTAKVRVTESSSGRTRLTKPSKNLPG